MSLPYNLKCCFTASHFFLFYGFSKWFLYAVLMSWYSLCRPGWPQILRSTFASASQGLEQWHAPPGPATASYFICIRTCGYPGLDAEITHFANRIFPSGCPLGMFTLFWAFSNKIFQIIVYFLGLIALISQLQFSKDLRLPPSLTAVVPHACSAPAFPKSCPLLHCTCT